MAYSAFLADRIRQSLAKLNTREVSMMGGLVFMVNEKMCVGIDQDKKTGEDRMMVRVGKLPYQTLLGTRGSREMDFTGKVMRGFLYVDPEGFDSDEDFDFWIDKALELNGLL